MNLNRGEPELIIGKAYRFLIPDRPLEGMPVEIGGDWVTVRPRTGAGNYVEEATYALRISSMHVIVGPL